MKISDFKALNHYLLRSPLLPQHVASDLLNLSDKEELKNVILHLYNKQHIKEAICLSSPGLQQLIEHNLYTKNTPDEKLYKSLFQYLIRMSTRCTPFGQFAGINMGKIDHDKKTVNSIVRNHKNTVCYRLDMQYLVAIAQYIISDLDIRYRLRYNKNHTVYRESTYYKFYRQSAKQENSQNHLCTVPATTAIDYILDKLNAPAEFSQIVNWLIEKGVSKEKTEIFINKMIENQLLVSEIHPILTGKDFLDILIEKLSHIDKKQQYLPTLTKIHKLLHSNLPLFDLQYEITALLDRKFPSITYKNLLQGDLHIGTSHNTITKKDIDRITSQLNALLPLGKNLGLADIKRFKKQFSERYEERMVPLLEALDPDTGIGYGNTSPQQQQDELLGDINWKKIVSDTNHSTPSYETLALDKYLQALDNSETEIKLTDAELKFIADTRTAPTSPPISSYAIGSLLKCSQQEQEILFYANNFGGVSAINLMSRFGHLDPNLQQFLQEIANMEQHNHPHALLAEIIHLPEARIGNILQRPQIRQIEIPIFGQAARDTVALPPNDLYLFIQNETLRLWSGSLQKEITPRLSTAHNYQQGISLYRFLADLQFQDQQLHVTWDWGICSTRPFLPRVRYKDIILNRATWNIKQDRNTTTHKIKSDYKLPRQVVLIEGDNELLLDLDNPISVNILRDKIIKGNIQLQEHLYMDFKSPVTDSDGNIYSNEIIIPLFRHDTIKPTIKRPISTNLQRRFPLGSKWIYAQIYCGPLAAEQLLQNPLPLLIQRLKDKKLLETWFFIRYDHPQHHLRFRVESKNTHDYKTIIELVQQYLTPFWEDGLINNIKFDTYVREIERYTPKYMEDSETLFMADSEHILQLIQHYPRSSDRWLPALKNIDTMLDQAGYSLSKKTIFCQRMKTAFAQEFGNDKNHDRHFDRLFRTKKQQIRSFIAQEQVTPWDQKRNQIISQVTAEFDDKQFSLLSSYIHMHINRLFASQPRVHEYATYHLLYNYYRMLAGIQKQTTVNRSSTITILSPCDYTTAAGIVAL